MSFTESVKTCLSKYATFSGRAQRPEYWWFALFYVVAVFLFSLVDAQIFGVDPTSGDSNGILTPLVQIALFLPLLGAGWRRMHDTGRPGWYILLPMAVSLATTVFLFLGVVSFAAFENAGADPEALRGPAAVLGLTGLMALLVIQLVLAILMIWWLTRPSEPQDNAYGPAPG